MNEQRYVVSEDRREELEQLIRDLPAMLSGNIPDRHDIAKFFKLRVGFAFLEQVCFAFDDKAMGRADSNGDTWPHLSPEYLAYGRPVTGTKPPRAGKGAPGGKDGFLDKAQLRRWRQVFAHAFHHCIMRESDSDARAHAAAVAWIVLKQEGAKTKLGTFGNRKAGVDYKILVSTGNMRRSLQPGEVTANGSTPGGPGMVCEDHQSYLIVGSNDPKAKFHHHGKGRRARRFWPKSLPSAWWVAIADKASSGIQRIGELFGRQG